jgi:hypothetical protein
VLTRQSLERVLGIERYRRHGSPDWPGDEKAALWQRPRTVATRPAKPGVSGRFDLPGAGTTDKNKARRFPGAPKRFGKNQRGASSITI